MKILYIIGQLGRGGAEQQLYYLLKYLKPEAVVVSLNSGGYWAGPIRELGIEVIELERRGRADVSRIFALIGIIRRYQPDIIHSFIDNTHGLYARLAAILTGHRRVIIGVRSHPTYDPKWYIWLRCRILNHFVRSVVANSHAAYDYLVTEMKLPGDKVRFIANGIEVDRIAAEATAGPNPLPADWRNHVVVGSVGSLSIVKDPHMFLAVAKKVLVELPDTRFVWVGDGELREELEREIDTMELRHAILLAGERYDVPRWLGAMDVFVMTSVLEGMPNALMEAAAVGLPCVVTDVGGCREIVKSMETGFTVDAGDSNALAQMLIKLLTDSSLRSRMGDAARIHMLQHDAKQMASRYEELYKLHAA